MSLPLAVIHLASRGLSALFDDPPFSALMLLGVLPPLGLMCWANLRAYGQVKSPLIDDTPVWLAFLVVIGGGAAVIGGGFGLATLLRLDGRALDLFMAYFVGLAFSGPVATLYLWQTRDHWRHPGAFEEGELDADLETFIEAEKEDWRRRPRDGRRGGA